MARGRLTDASITAVRETSRIDQVVAQYVTLKKAGPGSLKGLCPFHDEKGASFHVTPDRGFYHCFGCGEGGDVIAFLQKIENLDFIEAIERLADQFRVELTYEEYNGKPGGPDPDRGETRAVKARLIAAHQATADYYAAQLLTPEAIEARRFLSDRGFDRHAAADFGVGYSPNGWDTLIKHLHSLGYTPDELATAGLTSDGKNGPIDRFRGRLMFPIHDQTGDIIGFGARKLLPDDQDKGPKYLNTPETPIYKKSRVLFGLNRARKDISKTRKVIVVEGYTDVMACHLSGETTAVATCGTAFGEDHIRIIRRLLGDDGSGGEVIYTFDGDAAGQKAALRAFTMDDHFQTRTSVAVADNGEDPCEVRISHGPEGVRDLLANRIPLFEFALKTTLATYDLTTAEGRVNALEACAPIVAAIKHPEMRDGYTRQLSRWTGTDRTVVHGTVTHAANHPTTGPTRPAPESPRPDPNTGNGNEDPYPRPDPTYSPNSRDVLKILIQNHKYVPLAQAELHRGDFAHPTHKATWDALIAAHNDHTTDTTNWTQTVLNHAPSPTVAAFITELSVDQFRALNGITQETVTRTLITLTIEACHRRIDNIERTIADPDLDPTKITDLINTLTKTQHRAETAQARHMLIDGQQL